MTGQISLGERNRKVLSIDVVAEKGSDEDRKIVMAI